MKEFMIILSILFLIMFFVKTVFYDKTPKNPNINANNRSIEEIIDLLRDYKKNAIRLVSKKATESSISIGSSKLGGLPDVPKNFEWPYWKEQPLSFLAQINMADISKFEIPVIFKKKGLLTFFYDSEQSTWGFDPKDKGSWRIFYFDDITNLNRTSFPEDLEEHAKYNVCEISYEKVTCYPPWESSIIDSLTLSDHEIDNYIDYTDGKYEEASIHKLFGYPNQIQGDMRRDCQLASNNIYCGDAKSSSSKQAKNLLKDKEKWQLLFQLDSDENMEMMWGDVGRLYFWYHEEDIKDFKIDNIWMVLQCS